MWELVEASGRHVGDSQQIGDWEVDYDGQRKINCSIWQQNLDSPLFDQPSCQGMMRSVFSTQLTGVMDYQTPRLVTAPTFRAILYNEMYN